VKTDDTDPQITLTTPAIRAGVTDTILQRTEKVSTPGPASAIIRSTHHERDQPAPHKLSRRRRRRRQQRRQHRSSCPHRNPYTVQRQKQSHQHQPTHRSAVDAASTDPKARPYHPSLPNEESSRILRGSPRDAQQLRPAHAKTKRRAQVRRPGSPVPPKHGPANRQIQTHPEAPAFNGISNHTTGCFQPGLSKVSEQAHHLRRKRRQPNEAV
jgi:hypothetical protein